MKLQRNMNAGFNSIIVQLIQAITEAASGNLTEFQFYNSSINTTRRYRFGWAWLRFNSIIVQLIP